jgi:ABC-type branched-subunit amino acid transport system permease subunit
MAAWGLNLQFGLAGINSFAFIVFQAVGAYAAGVVTLGSPIGGLGQEEYVGGALLPFPLPLLVAVVVAGLLALPVGLVTLRRLRGDYEAMVMLVLSLIAVGVATAEVKIVNGPAGIYGVPKPLGTTLLANLTPLAYQWVYSGWAVLLTAVVFGVSAAISSSPFGRNLRALRENEAVVISSGRSAVGLRLQAFVIGAMIAGLSGGVAVEFIGAWSPGGWAYVETFVLITAIIVGGKGNLAGVALGTALVPVLLLEVTRFLPNLGYAGLIDSIEWVLIGIITLVFLWFRPRGLLPERRRRYGATRWLRFGAGAPRRSR